MGMNSGPVNCLLCLKSLRTHKPLKWQDDDVEQGIARDCCTTVNNQLSVIFLLRKLLEIPAVVCGELLQSYGDPYFWISCCDSCSVLVEKGRQIFSQLVLLQKQLEKVQDDLKSSIHNSGKLFSNGKNAEKGATGIVRSYIKKERRNDNAQNDKDNSISSEVDQAQLHCNSPLDCENGSNLDIPDVKLDLEILGYSPQSEDYLDIPLDENMMEVKPNFETVPEIWVRSDITDNSSIKKELNYHVEDITEDLNIPSGSNWEAIPLIPVTGGKEFASLTDLNRQKTHTEKTLSCKICKKVYSKADYFKRHICIQKGARPYICDVCGKGFSQAGSLKRHIRTHTGEKPYKCRSCGKGFVQGSALGKHVRIHTGEKPFKCEVCKKCFTYSTSLKDHLRCHTGEKPYKCEVCKKCFAHPSTLKKHLKSHNEDYILP